MGTRIPHSILVHNFLAIEIDLLAILQKRLDRALFLYIFIHDIRSSGVKASISIVQIRKFDKMLQNTIRFRIPFRIAKRSVAILFLKLSVVLNLDFNGK